MIRLRGLGARRGAFVLRELTLTVPSGTFLVIVGPSGAGKTTLLEAIAGLVPATGSIEVNGHEVSGEPAERRHVGLVSQDALLFPHLNVAQNIGFGLRRRMRASAIREAATVTGCSHLLARRPAGLSGGERQRVALARAIARRPEALLLDEPFGGLDPPVRREIRRELRALHRRLGATVLHVTHDLDEALELADQLGVLGEGTLVQVGPPAEVWRRPASPMVAALLGTDNLVAGEIRADPDRTGVPFPARLHAGPVELRGLATREGPGYAALRGEDITLSTEVVRSSALNQLAGIVTGVAPAGALVRVTIDTGVPLVAVVTRQSAAALELAPGLRVYAHFKATAVHLI